MELTPELKVQLLALVEHELIQLIGGADSASRKYAIDGDYISPVEELESEQFTEEADSLHAFRDALEADQADPELVSLWIDKLIDWRTKE